MLAEWRAPTISVRTLTTYEISDEINRRQIQVLERRYGGRLRAHKAASRIQRAFRESRLLRQWRRLVVPLQSLEMGEHFFPPARTSESAKPMHRYHPANASLRYPTVAIAPLTAQLRTTHYNGTTAISLRSSGGDRKEHGYTASSPRPVLECLSPFLTQRRNFTDMGHQAAHVWLPRSSLGLQHSSQSNSLPRLDKHTPPLSVNSSSSIHEVNDQKRKRQYRVALNFFNKKPTRGVQLLMDWGFVENNSLAVAKLLIGRRGLSKQMIGEYLGDLNHFQSSVLSHFIDLIDMHGMEIDVALRHALNFFRLPGEAQKIERIMQAFSERYAACNPEKAASFHNADTVFILAFAVVMLNTDLHSPNIKAARKMKLKDFIYNLRGIDAGHDIDRDLLVRIYCRIRDNEFRSGSDHVTQVLKVDQSIIGKDKPKLVEPHRRLVCYCRVNQVMDRGKQQAPNAHQREVFLFNDLMLVAKATSKKKLCNQYNLRLWISLSGARVRFFESSNYRYGITLATSDDHEFHFNSKNDDDRHRFVADVKESVAECNEMEAMRIESEIDKHTLLNHCDGQRDSGLSEMDINHSNDSPCTGGRTQSLGFFSTRRLSYNSFDSGVVDESSEIFTHSALSPLTTIFTNKHLEAAL